MPNRMSRGFGALLTLCLLVTAAASSAHFLLNLNVRIFHVEHTNEGIRIYARMPMPYLVADKIGVADVGALPTPAPFTSNAIENDKIVHYLNLSEFLSAPFGLGEIAEAASVIKIGAERHRGKVEAVVVHRVGREPGFATLSEARHAIATKTALTDEAPPYVGDVVVDLSLVYTPGFSPSRYTIASTLDPRCPDKTKPQT